MPLTDAAIRALKTPAKRTKVYDERGMFLELDPGGGRWWRFKYRRPVSGKENLLSLGVYPDVSLKLARERRDEARRLLAEGIDPGELRSESRRQRRQATGATFEAIAREWYGTQAGGWSEQHRERMLSMFERLLLPELGTRPIAEIGAPELLAVLRSIESAPKKVRLAKKAA